MYRIKYIYMKCWIIFIVICLPQMTALGQQVAKVKDCRIITATGTKVVINGGITFTGNSNWADSGEIFITKNTLGGRENWTDSTTTGAYTGTGRVHFTSDSLQYIYGNTAFYNLRVASDSGIYLNSNTEARNQLDLDKGLLYTSPLTKLRVSNTAINSVQSTNNFAHSWVHGRLERAASAASPAQYLFPVGKLKNGDSLYAPVKLARFSTTVANYAAEYFPEEPFDRNNVMSPPVDHISDIEYWEISSDIASGTGDDARVYLSWRGYSRVSNNAVIRDSLLVAQYLNAPPYRWDVPGGWVTGNAAGADSLSGYVASNGPIGSFTFNERRFTLGTFSQFNALPVKLLYWTATADSERVRLNWNVEQEQDILTYTTEHSTDGSRFSSISTITSLQKMAWLYTSYHNSPARGWNYYRLRITDKTGKVTYTAIRKLFFDENAPTVRMFPNPATTILHIQMPGSYAGNTTLSLYDVSGKQIAACKPAGSSIELDVLPLAKGSYFISIACRGTVTVYPFIKQ